MQAAVRESAVRWSVSGIVAVAVLALVLMLFRAPAGLAPAATPPAPPARVALQMGGTLWSDEEALLRDKSPLFVPTEWNARTNVLPVDAIGEPGESFHGYSAQFGFSEEAARVALPAEGELPADPAAALGVGRPEAPFHGIGRGERVVPTLTQRAAFLQIAEEQGGREVLSRAITGVQLPEARRWEPLEFVVAVEPLGMVGTPLLLKGSGSDQIDAFFQEYVAKTLRIGERLSPGYYRIQVAP